jgi:hypothetical protein
MVSLPLFPHLFPISRCRPPFLGSLISRTDDVIPLTCGSSHANAVSNDQLVQAFSWRRGLLGSQPLCVLFSHRPPSLRCFSLQRTKSNAPLLSASDSPGSYGYDSRAASIRIIGPPSVAPEATRFEVRVPGADVSYSLPYLLRSGGSELNC